MEVQVANGRFCGAQVCEEFFEVHELQSGEEVQATLTTFGLPLPERGAPKPESPWRRW
jgi:hypothetical protein